MSWPEALRERIPRALWDARQGEEDVRHDLVVVGTTGLGINVSINAGLCADSIVLQVHVDGLMKWT